MCTMLQARAYYSEFFRDVHSRAIKCYIEPFYIPSTHKELQFAAYYLVGEHCLNTPVQFPHQECNCGKGKYIHTWRSDDYLFLYDNKESFCEIPEKFRGFRQLSVFVLERNITDKRGLECITNPTQLIKHIIKEENMKVEQESSAKTTKAKTRLAPRLVFTYTNGATYTVRGVQEAEVLNMAIHYSTKTTDSEGNILYQKAIRKITNDFETVVIELPNGGKRVLLDLRADRTKKIEKPARKHKSREEYEAEQAQKEAEEAKLAKVEELLDEAAKLLK